MVEDNQRKRERRDWISEAVAVLAPTGFFERLAQWSSQVVTTAELLGIDPNDEMLKHLTKEQLAEVADIVYAKRKLDQELRNAPKLRTQVLMTFLHSELPQRKGRPTEKQYDLAYFRLKNGVCRTRPEAYDMMIEEMEEPEKSALRSDASACADGFLAFEAAMKRRKRKFG